MPASERMFIIAGFGLLIALLIGIEIGTNDWITPTVLLAVALVGGSYKLLFRNIRLEAIILSLLLIGNIVGNHGFAQISITSGTPIYFAEIGMVACAAIFLFRVALTREQPIPKTSLSWSIMAFLLLGGVRLCYDIYAKTGQTAMEAVRDSALVYYAVYFYIAYRMGELAGSRSLLEKCMFVGFLLLIPAYFLELFAPGLMAHLTLRGHPIIEHKGDLVGGLFAAGSFYFVLYSERGRVITALLSIISFFGMLLSSSRASYLGWAIAVALLLWVGKRRAAFYHFSALLIGIIGILSLQARGGGNQSDFVTRLSDKVSSLTDISGTSTSYRTDVGDSSANNNRFRTSWWTSVISETTEKAPFTGLGFGYDITTRFLRSYDLPLGEAQFSARSPHSVIVAIFGRMGVIGLISWLVINALVVTMTWRLTREIRRRELNPRVLVHVCGYVVILVTAYFGVVLEGPMGAIVFWSFLGLAASASDRIPVISSNPPESIPDPESEPSRRVVLSTGG